MRNSNLREILRARLGDGTFLTKEEAAQRYGVTIRTIERWKRRGWAPSYRALSRLWFKAEEVEDSLTKLGYLPKPTPKPK